MKDHSYVKRSPFRGHAGALSLQCDSGRGDGVRDSGSNSLRVRHHPHKFGSIIRKTTSGNNGNLSTRASNGAKASATAAAIAAGAPIVPASPTPFIPRQVLDAGDAMWASSHFTVSVAVGTK